MVELPVELAHESEGDRAELAQVHPFLLEPGQPECRILIVEDDPENATVLRQMLTRAGFQVRVAENGALGIEAFQEWRPHFIWMDLCMPQLRGTETTRRIRGLDGGAEVKIVAITASAYASDREALMSAGFDDFAFKPFRPAEIFGCMACHLGVRYAASKTVGSVRTGDPGFLRPEALAALPLELRRKLKDAVSSLIGGSEDAVLSGHFRSRTLIRIPESITAGMRFTPSCEASGTSGAFLPIANPPCARTGARLTVPATASSRHAWLPKAHSTTPVSFAHTGLRREAPMTDRRPIKTSTAAVRKIPDTHRCRVSPEARTMLVAIPTCAHTSVHQINELGKRRLEIVAADKDSQV